FRKIGIGIGRGFFAGLILALRIDRAGFAFVAVILAEGFRVVGDGWGVVALLRLLGLPGVQAVLNDGVVVVQHGFLDAYSAVVDVRVNLSGFGVAEEAAVVDEEALSIGARVR